MPNINAIVVYTASGIVTTNPPGAAVNHAWTLPLGGGTIQSGVPAAHQATVTWGTTTGTYTVRDVISAQTNSCGPVPFELENISVTNGGGCTDVAPSNCTASASNAFAVVVAWTDNSPNETGFEVQYSTDNTNWSVYSIESPNTTSTAGGTQGVTLAYNTFYYFRVRNLGTCNSDWSNVSSVLSAPLAPTSFATNATGSIYELNLTWFDPNINLGLNFMTYDVEAAHTTNPCISTNYRTIATVGAQSHLINNLKAGATNAYSVRVRSRNVDNFVSDWVVLTGQNPTLIVGPFNDNDPVTCAYWTN